MGRVLVEAVRAKGSGTRFVVAELLAVSGGLVALAAGFLWASTAALHNAYFSFFGERRTVLPLAYEDMIYQGALNQLSVLIWIAGVALIAWTVWAELEDSRFPMLMGVRMWIISAARPLSFVVGLALFWFVLQALQQAEKKGIDYARGFATAAENGYGPHIAVRKRIGDQDFSVFGFKIGCSDKHCLIYQPGSRKTTDGASAASGKTVQVTLDNLLCIATTRRSKGEPDVTAQSLGCVAP